jgi:hypothetical protein
MSLAGIGRRKQTFYVMHAVRVEKTNHYGEVWMKIKFIGSCGLFAALGICFSLPAAQAGDRKDAVPRNARPDSRFSDFISKSPPSSSSRHSGATSFFVTNSESKFSRLQRNSTTKEKESAPTPEKERKKIILFQFDRKFGDVSVQPVVGQVNGAQVSVGF